MLVEGVVEDLIKIISRYPIDPHLDGASEEDIENLRNITIIMYQALLNCSKNSLNAVKKRTSKTDQSQSEPVEEMSLRMKTIRMTLTVPFRLL